MSRFLILLNAIGGKSLVSQRDFSFQTGKAPGPRVMAEEALSLSPRHSHMVVTTAEEYYKSGKLLIFRDFLFDHHRHMFLVCRHAGVPFVYRFCLLDLISRLSISPAISYLLFPTARARPQRWQGGSSTSSP